MDRRTVGILGGGQLGRMMIEAANRLGVRIAVLDPGGPSSPAGQLSHLCIEGSFQDETRIRELASVSDIITTEIEHVNVTALQELESSGSIVHPAAATLLVIQDKFAQKNYLHERQIAQTDFAPIENEQDARDFGMQHGYPFMLKNRKLAYDGRGNAVVNNAGEVASNFHKLGGADLYAERMVPFAKELAVMVVRCKEGVFAYPVVETVQVNSICQVVSVPAQIGVTATNTAVSLAIQAVSAFEGHGVYGVEMFLLHDDSVLVNEIAPRPHNSGHYTIEACEVDQFEMHLRAVLGMPCPPPQLRVAAAMMVNVLGQDTMEDTKEILHRALTVPGASIHWYGKLENRPGRKMAHITVTAHNTAELRARMEKLGISAQLHRLPAAGPRVGVIMGSDSDLAVMKQAAEVLERFQVPYELTIVSAHRTPTRLYSYAQSAAERGLQVIIAGAGGAAHLPGMVAALCSLPVIGVPMHTAAFSGNDSLLSIVQMPRGVPVATVAIGNAANAALLAVRMLAAQDKVLLAAMDDFMLKQEEEVLRKAAKLEGVGHEEYLNNQSR